MELHNTTGTQQRPEDVILTRSHVPMMFSSMLIFHVAATLCMCLRFYSKRVSQARYFLDDYVLIISWIIAIAYIFIALYMTRFGLGLDMGDFRSLFHEERWFFTPAVTFSAITACWVSKLSFFITLLRLVSRRWQKAMLWFFMTTSTASLIVLSVLQAFTECGSVISVLRHHQPGNNYKGCAHPRMTRAFSIYASVYATAMDFILSLVPPFVIWILKMKRAEKIAIICAMSTGCFAGGVSVLKVVKTYALLYDGSADRSLNAWDDPNERFKGSGRWPENFKDPYKGGLVCALNSVEVSCTIIAASIPFFRPLIRRLTGKKQGTHEEPVAMSAIPGSCGGHARLDSISDSGRKPPRDDDSVAILELERKL